MKKCIISIILAIFVTLNLNARDKNIVKGDDVWVPKSAIADEIAYERDANQCFVACEANGWLVEGYPGDAEMRGYMMFQGTGKLEKYMCAKGMRGIKFCVAQKIDELYNEKSWHFGKDIYETGENDADNKKLYVQEKPEIPEQIPESRPAPEPVTNNITNIVFVEQTPEPTVEPEPELEATPGPRLSKAELIMKIYGAKAEEVEKMTPRSDENFFYLDQQQIICAPAETMPGEAGEWRRITFTGMGQIDVLEQVADPRESNFTGSSQEYFIDEGQNSVLVNLKYGRHFTLVKVSEKTQDRVYLDLSDKYRSERMPPILIGTHVVKLDFSQTQFDKNRVILSLVLKIE